MTSLMRALGIDQLSEGDRAQLADEILESLDGAEPSPLSEELRCELDRRIAYFDAHPDEVEPWAEVKGANSGEAQQMSLPVALTAAAQLDLVQAVAWYEQQRAGLGAKFFARVEETLQRISDFPELCAPLYKDTCRARVRRFPYGVFYRLRATDIEVTAIVHARRHPSVWKGRP